MPSRAQRSAKKPVPGQNGLDTDDQILTIGALNGLEGKHLWTGFLILRCSRQGCASYGVKVLCRQLPDSDGKHIRGVGR